MAGEVLPEVKKHYGKARNYVDGEWVESSSTRALPVENPATGEIIGEVPMSTTEEVDEAVAAAHEAFEEWRETPPHIRVQPLYRLKSLIEESFEEIARILTQEHGKVIDEALGSVRRTVDNIEFACGIPSLMMGDYLEDGAAAGMDEVAIRQPLGVFAGIVPFNFPAMVPFWFWPTAVACGNTFVVKPSEQVPMTQQKIFELIDEAGFPEGVISMVNGDKETSGALIRHPKVRGISFVGSTPVAQAIYSEAASLGKRVQCQGGAKNFITVMPDANMDVCVPNMIASFFGNSGQRCLAGAVLVLVGDAADSVLDRFVTAAAKLKLGYGLEPSVQMGPVAGRPHMERIVGFIDKGEAEGARLVLDGRGVKVSGYEKGCFVGPTIMDEVSAESTVVQEEIFGPVVAVVRARSLDEAIELANGSRFGNASSIYTSNGKAAREYVYRVEAGNIGVNIGVAAPMAFFPFGGMKESFFGDLHGQGKDGLNFFTDRKVVVQRWC